MSRYQSLILILQSLEYASPNTMGNATPSNSDCKREEEESLFTLTHATDFSMCRFFAMQDFPTPSQPPQVFALWSDWGRAVLLCWNTHIHVRDYGVKEEEAQRIREEPTLTFTKQEVRGVWACLSDVISTTSTVGAKKEASTVFALIQMHDPCVVWHWNPVALDRRCDDDNDSFVKVHIPSPIVGIQAQRDSFGTIALENGLCAPLWRLVYSEKVNWFSVSCLVFWLKMLKVDVWLHEVIDDSTMPHPNPVIQKIREKVKPALVTMRHVII